MKEKYFLTHLKGHRHSTKRKTRLLDSFQQHGQNASSRSGEKIRLQIQIHQPNNVVNALIQSDIHLQVTAKAGMRNTDDPQSKDITEPEAFFLIAKNPKIARTAQLAVLELLRQPEGMYRS